MPETLEETEALEKSAQERVAGLEKEAEVARQAIATAKKEVAKLRETASPEQAGSLADVSRSLEIAQRAIRIRADLKSVFFLNEHEGWSVGRGGIILATTDAGKRWTQQKSGTTLFLNSVHFANENTGWAVGGVGIIRSTTDAGKTWTPQKSGTTKSLYSVHFASEDTGWAVGQRGAILATTDAGKTWTRQVSGSIETVYSVHFANETTGWAVGDKGTILHTMDGGETWVSQNP